jgi:hypothetical protein
LVVTVEDDRRELKAEVAAILERVVADQDAAESALELFQSAAMEARADWKSGALQSARHLLAHFVDDADLRTTDEKYDKLQRKGLLRAAARLRAEIGN